MEEIHICTLQQQQKHFENTKISFFVLMHNMVLPRNHLFESTKNGGGFDLVAMNIQRGRQIDSTHIHFLH